MERQSAGENPFEVYCYNCDVSAPPDAKRCVHCGSRLSKSRHAAPIERPSPFDGEEGAEAPRKGITSAMSVVWILLFVVGIVYRICG